MAQRRRTTNRNGNLEQATALLMQNQAPFLVRLGALDRELEKLKRETVERLGNIEALLARHELILEGLSEAIRQKIGFKAK